MKKKTSELQSRREFFKKAAKGVLPILGAIMLANIPISKAIASIQCEGCDGGCQGSCIDTCRGNCSGGCNDSCKGTCADSCKGSCSDVCKH